MTPEQLTAAREHMRRIRAECAKEGMATEVQHYTIAVRVIDEKLSNANPQNQEKSE